jgi:hypothetical protein
MVVNWNLSAADLGSDIRRGAACLPRLYNSISHTRQPRDKPKVEVEKSRLVYCFIEPNTDGTSMVRWFHGVFSNTNILSYYGAYFSIICRSTSSQISASSFLFQQRGPGNRNRQIM